MLHNIIKFSVHNKLIIILFTLTIVGFGLYSVYHIPVGSVPDITNNQVQIITTSGNLSTQEIEQFITAPVEMEMANLPGVVEIRSISKFGISVVTVVFEENMGTYLPRQLIAEKIKSASEKIPESYGTPEMGPVSTGLGEIYQYILDIKPGYENMYSPMDLRTIQDWIVKRRLSGINGVVEVNSWGGYLKQYEVSINPYQLIETDISLIDVYEALKNNNNISGGAYIEKKKQSYFIRGDGQIKSIDNIKNTFIMEIDGVPIFVKDIAEVKYGYANRFGAITANGKGETILGQVMMLKDANSKTVINAVKERIDEIQKNLPEGVFINPILERGELISKTSKTVVDNLIFGAIIVFITVFLLLGNVRSALVIASMIPLALLFTISMMYIFGIDANLMSLGALDFGIIIDGAVIIVEYIILTLSVKENKKKLYNNKKKNTASFDEISILGSSKMMKSAIFGQVIILIVFIPILSLRGVEGKMFHPMALSFSFAIIGAMILGLTWLPVASSLFLKPENFSKKNIANLIINQVYKLYYPLIKWSCGHKRMVLSAAIISLVFTGFLFSRIGGEFVPTLDEGDFVIQPALETGTSLSETINMTTKMENVLIKEYPDEVDQIVCRIGAAEVPTDPMSMEEIDMIIKLHPKKQWKKAKSKQELANKFKESLEVFPDIEYEFTQPIEMRFNELITGVRADIAIKVYGEDLDYIFDKATEIKNLISEVEGADDIILEKTTGLPQIKVSYNRQNLATHNMDIASLNSYLSAAFGGVSAGVVFEGEKRFDMVLRFDKNFRTDIQDIKNLFITTPDGEQIPLSEFANIEYDTGPAKISRDDTHRRVVVSINVRNRDLQSVVDDVKELIQANIIMEPGNYIEYGGQFENLENASKRLLIALPVALLLIFIFLHFAFKSLKDAIMIFTAIPLATVGGVTLLWIRGMPFSVSAGVGFIALFGIAVLNGIVLIEHFKELQNNGIKNMRELIIQGTKDRLRPVLLTAGAAAMGFLPMAISTGAGAEVQRPLATVVIGGLVTSTMLTLIALPLLYEIFYNVVGVKFFPLRFIRSKSCVVTIALILFPSLSFYGQEKDLNLEQLKEIALENNLKLKTHSLVSRQKKALIRSAYSIPKTQISVGTDQNNIAENGYPLNILSVEQEFDFPGKYKNQKNIKRTEHALADLAYHNEVKKVLKELSISYYENVVLSKRIEHLKYLDSLYTGLSKNFDNSDYQSYINNRDKLLFQTKHNEVSVKLSKTISERKISNSKLKYIINSKEDFSISDEIDIEFSKVISADTSLIYKYLELIQNYSKAQISLEKNNAMPDFSINYFVGTNAYSDSKTYHGFNLALGIPIFYSSYKNSIEAAKINYEITQNDKENLIADLNLQLLSLKLLMQNYSEMLEMFNSGELELGNEIERSAINSFKNNEIDLIHFVKEIEESIRIKNDYYDLLLNYYKTHFQLLYFTF